MSLIWQVLFSYARPALFVVIAGLLVFAFTSDCNGILLYFSILLAASLVFPLVLRGAGKSNLPVLVLFRRAAIVAGLFFSGGVVVAGTIGVIRDGAFMTAACDGANTAARLATFMLKFIAHAL